LAEVEQILKTICANFSEVFIEPLQKIPFVFTGKGKAQLRSDVRFGAAIIDLERLSFVSARIFFFFFFFYVFILLFFFFFFFYVFFYVFFFFFFFLLKAKF
jgi:hypothetical protein